MDEKELNKIYINYYSTLLTNYNHKKKQKRVIFSYLLDFYF